MFSSVEKLDKVNKACSSLRNEEEEVEHKIIVEFSESFHILQMAKALEKEVGKVKYAKYLNNKLILLCAVSKEQQCKLMKMKMMAKQSQLTFPDLKQEEEERFMGFLYM